MIYAIAIPLLFYLVELLLCWVFQLGGNSIVWLTGGNVLLHLVSWYFGWMWIYRTTVQLLMCSFAGMLGVGLFLFFAGIVHWHEDNIALGAVIIHVAVSMCFLITMVVRGIDPLLPQSGRIL